MHTDHSPNSPASTGTAFRTVADITPAGGAVSSSESADHPSEPPQSEVGKGRHSLTDADREKAIERAAALVEYLHALSQLHWALCNGEGDYFTHRAAYDQALSDCHAARGIMERLIKGRSAAQIARMEAERGLDLPACANEGYAR